jgi:transposase
VISLLMTLITILAQRLGRHSQNSHLPASKNPIGFKKNRSLRAASKRPKGGQHGHVGTTLVKVPEPDEIVEHRIESCLSCAKKFTYQDEIEFESRQVFEIYLNTVVVEHRAETKECRSCGKKSTAKFPAAVTKAVQYGPTVKALSCYMSQAQLIPYNRIEELFRDFAGLPISQATLVSFNEEAFAKLSNFEEHLKRQLLKSKVNHVDETGISVNKDNYWLHVLSNEKWTYMLPHIGRNASAGQVMGVLEKYEGYLVHDHWKPYFQFKNCTHVLCNAHHLRELEWAHEFEEQAWAKKMKDLLLEMNQRCIESPDGLEGDAQAAFQKRYRSILKTGEKECPKNTQLAAKSKNKKLKQSKSRNLLERLKDFETETLMFMRIPGVPFTNNQAERDIRMAKVQKKISGCFRSLNGAYIFCRIRSFVSSAKKHSRSPLHCLEQLFAENRWEFAE